MPLAPQVTSRGSRQCPGVACPYRGFNCDATTCRCAPCGCSTCRQRTAKAQRSTTGLRSDEAAVLERERREQQMIMDLR